MQHLYLPWFRLVLDAGLRRSQLHEYQSGHSETFRRALLVEFDRILSTSGGRPSITAFSLTDGVNNWTIKQNEHIWVRSSSRAKSGRPPVKQARNARLKRLYPVFHAAAKELRLAIKRLPENTKRRRSLIDDSESEAEAFILRLKSSLPEGNTRAWVRDLGVMDGFVSYGLSESKMQLEFLWSDFVRGQFAPSDLAKASLGAWHRLERDTVHKALADPKRKKNTREKKSPQIR
jgi:hypothetical protein